MQPRTMGNGKVGRLAAQESFFIPPPTYVIKSNRDMQTGQRFAEFHRGGILKEDVIDVMSAKCRRCLYDKLAQCTS